MSRGSHWRLLLGGSSKYTGYLEIDLHSPLSRLPKRLLGDQLFCACHVPGTLQPSQAVYSFLMYPSHTSYQTLIRT